MKNFVLVYAIIQLISTAYGLAVIESVKPIVKPKDDKTEKNKNSLYNYNSTFVDVLKGFIPFYYFAKALSLLTVSKMKTETTVSNDNKYLNENEVTIIEEPKNDIFVNPPVNLEKERPERYVARKNDISVFDTFETPIEYITRQNKANSDIKEENLELTPFLGGNNVVEHVVIKEEVTKSDIAKAIAELNPEELEALKEKIALLADMKKRNVSLRLEKDAA